LEIIVLAVCQPLCHYVKQKMRDSQSHMLIGYIRLQKSGPSREEQEAALAAAGVVLDLDASLYVEPMPKRGRTATYDQRAEAIRALRDGDRLVIHSAPRLGSTEAEIREAAAAVSAQGAVLWDCAAGLEVRHHPDAGRLVVWARAGALLAAQERLAKARKGITRRAVTPLALTGKRLARAKELWADLDISAATIAKELGVSVRTLYRHLPKRRDT
jgi:DNA invertase Pin-like site-specific DNA recombinase